MTTYKIALIPGDGIGLDVTDATMEVLYKAGERFGFDLESEEFPWSCDYYLKNGVMMPEDGIAQLSKFDAIYLGAVGWPETVPDAVSLHGLLLPIRKAFDQYANIRPHRLLSGVEGPLKSEAFDILCIRENTEGEYSCAGGRVHQGRDNEVATEVSVFTRKGVERIIRFGFEQARSRRNHLTSVTKSNAQKYSMVFWDEVTREVAEDYPDVTVSHMHIDAMCAKMVMAPQSLDVVVASNLFGDILTDLGAAIQGGLGFAASANICPDSSVPSMFEPVHGSAPDVAGKNIANPIAAIWSGAMMLDHIGEKSAADAVLAAIEMCTSRGIGSQHGQNVTEEITAEILVAIEECV